MRLSYIGTSKAPLIEKCIIDAFHKVVSLKYLGQRIIVYTPHAMGHISILLVKFSLLIYFLCHMLLSESHML